MNTKKLSLILAPAVTLALLELARFFKVSALGHNMHSFSLFTAAGPLAGLFSGSAIGLFLYVAVRFLKVGFLGAGFFTPFSCYVPTLFGSLYFSRADAFIRLFVPLICFALFVTHPIGGQAFVYAFFWLIPVALYFVPQNIFSLALGATFVQHAVGSIIWLYCIPMTAEQWLGLIPVVCVERLVFAVSMVVVYTMIQFALTIALPNEKTVSPSA